MKFNFSFETGSKKRKKAPLSVDNFDRKKPKSAKIGSTITEQQMFRARQDISKWRLALTFAEQTLTPNRIELIRIYQDIILDSHLSAVIQTRKINVLGKSYNIKKENGDIDEEATETFRSAWFRKFTDLALDSLFWGTTLIEFGDIVDNLLTDVELIKYENLNPEKQIVKKNIFSSEDGASYVNPPFSKWNVEVLEQERFGLLNKCVPLIIWKKAALGAWSIRADIFGMPLRIGKTDTRNEESRGKMIEMMQNMDKATWGVFDESDSVEFVETSSGTAGHNIYKDLANQMNSEISKLILGQTGTTDEKAFSGSAEVHERVSFEYTKSDMVWFAHLVNDVLIPKMIALECMPKGSVFGFDTKEILSAKAQLEVDKVLLQFYNIPEDVIEERYNTEVEIKAPGEGGAGGIAPVNTSVFNNLQKMYEGYFKDDQCC